MKAQPCSTCLKSSHNLMSANCGHKICFQCVKMNKNSHKCSNCANKTRGVNPSPTKGLFERKNENRHQNSSTRHENSSSKREYKYPQSSPRNLNTSRRSLHKSSVNVIFEECNERSSQQMICKEHHEPFTLFCRSSKELICSVCLCTRFRKGSQIMPLKEAEQFLKRQTKLQKEESREVLGSIDRAQKIMRKNGEVFKSCYQQHLQLMENLFREVRAAVDSLQTEKTNSLADFFEAKLREINEIHQDLNYLSTTLREYRDSFKEPAPLNELVYLFTSYKMIRTTLSNLNFDYLPYLKEPHLFEVNRTPISNMMSDLIKLRLVLPLKYEQKRKRRSLKSAGRTREEQGRGGCTPPRASKHHQLSLCSNIHGLDMCDEQKSVYKILLNAKLKA